MIDVCLFCTGINQEQFVREEVLRSGVDESHPLYSLVSSLTSHLLDSKSDNTVKKYFYGFMKWEKFINNHNLSSLPASPVHVALYLSFLLDSGCTYSTISTAVYSIEWAHDMCGKLDPTNNSFVQNLVESAKRTAKPIVNKKDPVSTDILIKLCDMFQFSTDLLVVRDLLMILIGFSGFLRFNELSQLRCNDVIVKDDHLVIKIRGSKTDQYRSGDEVLISKGQTVACPYNMFFRYVNLASLNLSSEMFIFRPLYRSKDKCSLVRVNKPISYTTARECVIKSLKLVAPDLNLGLHSLRSGGATRAANSGVGDRCWKRHGRWKSDSSKDGYVEDSVENRLGVSKTLGL